MLTKSDFVKFLQCRKYLWLHKNRKDLLPAEIDAALERRFEEGFALENFAYKLFPGGESAADDDIKAALGKTEALVRKGTRVIYQPTFSDRRAGTFCRCDIIKARGKRYDIYEVKSSTSVKDVHIADVAFQKVCLEDAGVKVGRLSVIRVNNDYVRRGDIEPEKLLATEDVTDEAEALLADAKGQIRDALATLRLEEEPDVRILKQCGNPYDCPFIGYCWRDIPEPSIYDAGLSEKRLAQLLDEGILKMEDVPEEMMTKPLKLLFYRAVKSGRPLIDRKEIAAWLAELEYPLYHLDYETYGSVLPPFDGYRPYQNIPFQYSLHVQKAPGAEPEHHEFLATEPGDPVPALVESLKRHIGPKGSVLAWHMDFEKGRNEEMAGHCPESAGFFRSVNERMRDLKEPFSLGYFVHKDFGGSASLKAVLPVLIPELSYKNLAIQEGGTASGSWPVLVGGELESAEKERLASDMLAYCGRDTLAMVRILELLRGL